MNATAAAPAIVVRHDPTVIMFPSFRAVCRMFEIRGDTARHAGSFVRAHTPAPNTYHGTHGESTAQPRSCRGFQGSDGELSESGASVCGARLTRHQRRTRDA